MAPAHAPGASRVAEAPDRQPLKHELARAQRENARLQLKLEHAEKLLALQKKLADMMEAIEPTNENEGSSA